jgi:hypothetical protein
LRNTPYDTVDLASFLLITEHLRPFDESIGSSKVSSPGSMPDPHPADPGGMLDPPATDRTECARSIKEVRMKCHASERKWAIPAVDQQIVGTCHTQRPDG